MQFGINMQQNKTIAKIDRNRYKYHEFLDIYLFHFSRMYTSISKDTLTKQWAQSKGIENLFQT